MGLWDFIKSKIIKKNLKALPEPEMKKKPAEYNNGQKSFNESINVGYTPKIEEEFSPKVGTLEFAIQQYLYRLQDHNQHGIPFNSYKALTEICGISTTNPGNNKQNEDRVINRMKSDGRVKIKNQPNGKNGICYRHIQHGRGAEDTDTRLYINCKRENIAALAEKFYEEFGNNPYYFKFGTDEQASGKRRSEQFVFYLKSDPKELNGVIETIDRTRKKYPQLFEGAEYMNPFMRDVKGYIAYAPDIKTDFYHRMNGEYSILSAHSYNTLLGEALEDSFTHAMQDIVSHDYELSKAMNGEYHGTPQPYVNAVLEKINSNPIEQKKLVAKIKDNLRICSKNNSLLSIRGLEEQNRSR